MTKSFIPKIKKTLKGKQLKILFVATEAAPFAKAGGLGSVMEALPQALKSLNQDVRVMIPRYGIIEPEKFEIETALRELKVPTEQRGPYPYLICNVRQYTGKKSVPAYFLENMEYFEKRTNVYGYSDDHVRWVLFCRGVLEFLRQADWKPDIIVASDWQTGLVPNLLKTTYKNDPALKKIKSVFVIHNLRYQGMTDFKFMQEEEKDEGTAPVPDFFSEKLPKLNWLLRGIIYSDATVTVSPSYAKEILTEEYGEGLHSFLKEKEDKVFGILNGIDYSHYSPKKSPHIPIHYNWETIHKKKENKIHLQKRCNLKEDKNAFVVGMVSRFSRQKGFDLLEEIIGPLTKNLKAQLIFVGDGDPRYKEMILKMINDYPGLVGACMEFSLELPHLVWAGADAILMPSKFEPCGIVQMEAMKYGCIPIARATGGLKDTIIDFDLKRGRGNGFVFQEYSPMALYTAVAKAKFCYNQPRLWKKIIKNAMAQDLSWKKSAQKYLALFQKITT